MSEDRKLVLLNNSLTKARTGRSRLAKDRSERIDEAEQELYESSLSLLRDAAQFGDVDPSDTNCPPAWIKKWGITEATRRFRLCRAAWLPGKDAPSGLGLAKYVVGAFAKSRADAKRPHSLNMTLIQMIGGPRIFPEMEIQESGDK
jgi:hypothetical protein